MVTMLHVQWLGGGGAPARDVNTVAVVAVREAVIIIVIIFIVMNIKCIKCETEGLLIVRQQPPGL